MTERSNLRLQIARNGVVLLGGQAALIVSSAITSFAVARQLGTVQFGEYNAILAFVGMFLPIAMFGLDIALVREMSQDPDRAPSILGTGLILRLAASLAAMLLCLGACLYLDYSPRERYLIAIWSLNLLFTAGQLFQAPFAVSLNNVRPIALTTAVAFAGTLVKLAMVVMGAALVSYLVVSLAVALLTSLLLWHAAHFYSAIRPDWKVDWGRWKRLTRDCFPLLLSSLFVGVLWRIDQQFLLRWRDAQEVGYYAAAVRLAELLQLLPWFFMRAAFPIISAAAAEPGNASVKMSSACYRYMYLVAFPAVFAGVLFAPVLIRIAYGASYSPGAAALPWLMAAEIPVIGGVVYGHFSIAAKLQWFDVIFTFVNMLTNVILCVVLIPKTGLVGASIAALASYGICIPLQLVFRATRSYSLILVQETVRLLAVGFLTAAGYYTANRLLSVPFSLIVAFAVFLAASIALKLLRREDFRFLFA